MKKIILVFSCLVLLTTNIRAQQACEDNGSGTGSVNGTHTDPTTGVGGATPTNNTYQKNTFDWKATSWPFYLNNGSGAIFNTINNPFNSTDAYLLKQIAKDLTHSDFFPEDGWELIKQDMGFYYGSNNYNGNGNNIWDGGGNNHDNTVFSSSYDPMGYLLLYNKYTGMLRVFANLPIINGAQDKIYVHLEFTQNSGDNVSALFDHYNNPTTTRTLPLDQKTIVKDIGAVAAYPAIGSNKFLFADFQLAYDPCVCVYQSGLHVYFEHINTAQVHLTGRFAGTANPLTVASVNSGSGTSYGDGSNAGENFIASVFVNGQAPEAVMQSYNSLLNAPPDADPNTPNVATAIDALAAFTGATISLIDGNPEGIKDALEGISKTIDFFSHKQDNANANTDNHQHPMLLSGYLSLTGNVTTTILDNGYDTYIAVPGSPETTDGQQPTEYPFNYSGDAIPAYPIYNEPLGTFNLLQTPQVNEYRYIPSLISYNNPVTGTPEVATAYGDNIKFEYHPTSDLIYALNPIFDESKSRIYVAYEIDGQPTPFVYGDPLFIHYAFGKTSTDDLDFLFSTNPSDKVNSVERYRTKTFPIGCNQSIYTKEQYAFVDFTTSNTSDPTYYTYVNKTRNVTLVVLLELISKPDVYGKTHYTTQIMKYNCKVNPVSVDFDATNPGAAALAAFSNISNNLQIHTTTYTSPQDIYSFGTITIDGNQVNTSSGIVNIVGENAINVSGGVSITGDINLSVQGLPNYYAACSNTSIPSLTGSNLTAYCTSGYNGNQYMANQSRTMASNNNGPKKPTTNSVQSLTVTKLGTDIKLGIFPNPTSGLVYLNMSAQKAGNVITTITDIDGRLVANNTYSAEVGANSFKLDLSNVQNGVYAIKVTDDEGSIIKMDKIIVTK